MSPYTDTERAALFLLENPTIHPQALSTETLAALLTEVRKPLVDKLEELAEELGELVEANYPSRGIYPDETRRYERDMGRVWEAQRMVEEARRA